MFLDIAHLVLQYYFRYDVVHCTNVSDIDDKVHILLLNFYIIY